MVVSGKTTIVDGINLQNYETLRDDFPFKTAGILSSTGTLAHLGQYIARSATFEHTTMAMIAVSWKLQSHSRTKPFGSSLGCVALFRCSGSVWSVFLFPNMSAKPALTPKLSSFTTRAGAS